MEVVQQINFDGRYLNVYRSLEEPLFLGADVAELIGYSPGKVGQMLNTVSNSEKLNDKKYRAGQKRDMWFLTEDGLNTVLLRSNKPVAHDLRIFVNRNLREMRREMKLSPAEWFEYVHNEAYQEELAVEKWYNYEEGRYENGYWRWVELGRPHLKIDPKGPPYYEGEEEL